MKYIYLLFFILGMIAYNFIPKDFNIIDQPVASQNEASYIESGGLGTQCIIVQHMHMVGVDLQPDKVAGCSGKLVDLKK